MTVAELIEHLKTLPQDYIVKSEDQNSSSDQDTSAQLIEADDIRKVVVI